MVVNTKLMIAFCKKISLKQIVGAQIQTRPIKATSKEKLQFATQLHHFANNTQKNFEKVTNEERVSNLSKS